MRPITAIALVLGLCSCASQPGAQSTAPGAHARSHALAVGAEPGPGAHRANVPVSVSGASWFLKVNAKFTGPVELYLVDKPESVIDASNGLALSCSMRGDTAVIDLPATRKGAVTIAVSWADTAWDKAMRAFDEKDRAAFPAANGTLFVGSSTVVMWDLDRYFPELHAVNRGFGGSEYFDAWFYADRVILPYRPKTIVIYDGDNDLARSKSPERVAADFEALVTKIRSHLPTTRIVVLSIKPSVARWNLWAAMQKTNALIAQQVKGKANMSYVDISSAILGPDGKPRPDLLREDGLHLNRAGYDRVTAVVKPVLDSAGK